MRLRAIRDSADEIGEGLVAARARFLSAHDATPFADAWGSESSVRTVSGAAHPASVLQPVTLIVYGWRAVEPGTLSWVFPSLDAALTAAHAMTNATRWQIVAGARDTEIDVAQERSSGTVLVEEPGEA